MNRLLLLAIASSTFIGCAAQHTDTASKLEEWKRQIDISIPVGTDTQKVKAWFEGKGIAVQPNISGKSTDMQAWLEMLPAKELYCDKWMLQVLIETAEDNKVSAYKYQALGACL